MQALILAAGRGTRLQPITDNIPKAMVPINGKPMLELILEQLKTIKITKAVIIVHHLKEKIIKHFGNEYKGIKLEYVEQKEMKGTADAVLCAEKHITDDKFICIACDSLFETELLNKLIKHKSQGVITCKEVENPTRYGILVTEGKKVKQILEKPQNPPTNLANFSIYLFPREIFNACKNLKPHDKGEYWITDAIQKLIDDGMTFEYETAKHAMDIGTPEQLKDAEKLATKLGL